MESPQQTPLSNKNRDIISALKRDFEGYRKEAELIPGSLSASIQKPVLFILQWVAFFFVLALIFLLLFVAISGKDMAAGIASKYFNVPTDQLSDQGLSGIKSLLNWMFFIMALLFALLGYNDNAKNGQQICRYQ